MNAHIKSIASPPPKLYPWQRPESGVTTIGIIDPCYGSSHVIYGLPTTRYRHRSLTKLPLKKLDRDVTFFQFTPFVLNGSLPLLHTWNSLPLNQDFIVSFELELPRYLGGPSKKQILRGMRILASDRCKRILALSDFAYNFALRQFNEMGFPELEHKMSVFRGAVSEGFARMGSMSRPPRPSFDEKPLNAVVIGTQLFRKGGMHALMAFEKLRDEGMEVNLTLIGDFETSSYAFGEEIPDATAWRERARRHDWVRFIGPVPNTQVVEELLAHDVCIYTSLDESLGWLPIEAGMLGVPVIGAGVCAFPELIADGETGWLVPLPLREDGRWAGLEVTGPGKRQALEHANAAICDGIVEAFRAIRKDPAILTKLGSGAHEKMSRLYGLRPAAEKLEAIYDEVLEEMKRR